MMVVLSEASNLIERQMCWRHNLWDWCSILMGATTFVSAYTMGIIAWKRGASGIFVTFDFSLAVAGLLCFYSKLLKIDRQMCWRHNLWHWCSILMGATIFVSAYTMGIIAWKRGASGIFVTSDFLLAVAGLIYFYSKLLKITAHATKEEKDLILQDHNQIDNCWSPNHVKNNSIKDAKPPVTLQNLI